MRNVRVGEDGEFRCWKCGGRSFTLKRTFRSKLLVGVGALLTKKKLKCQSCGEFNDVGNAKPYQAPKSAGEAAKVTPRVGTPAWASDPTARHELRYWDGASWTEHVADAGVQSTDSGGEQQPAAVGGPVDVADQLRKLAELRDEGVLTDDEFDAQKARLLGPSTAAG